MNLRSGYSSMPDPVTQPPSIELAGVSLSIPLASFETRLRKVVRRALVPGNDTRVTILEDVNLGIRQGESVGIIGRNGAGKSSLIRLMSGIYTPTTGTIRTEGRISSILSLNVGFKKDLTGRQNIDLRARLLGMNGRQIRDKLPEIIEFCELGAAIDRPLHTYSSGMALRLAFAITTAIHPDILLMDEWIGAGDRVFRRKADERLHQITTAANILVVASHNHKLLLKYCTRGIVMDGGQVVFDGTTEEAIAYYEENTL